MNAPLVSFDALPVECVALILSKCNPKDVAAFATVRKTWNAAAQQDDVWNKWLRFKDCFKSHFPDVCHSASGREVFHALRRGSFSHSKNGKLPNVPQSRGATCQEYLATVDPSTGGVSIHLSAFRCLYFYLRNDTEHCLEDLWITPYGLWPTSAAGATFPNSAALASGLFHIHGELDPDFSLPAGRYSLSFKIGTPPALRSNAFFPALCQVTMPGEPSPSVNVQVNLHKDGTPARMTGRELAKGSEDDGEAAQEPEFWAKSKDPEANFLFSGPWDALNKQILEAASFFAPHWQISDGERVKPWKLTKVPLTWKEFKVGEFTLRDVEGSGMCSLALDVLLTDLECRSFKGAIWLDSLIISQLLD